MVLSGCSAEGFVRFHEVDFEIFLVASVLAYFVYDFADELVALSGMAIQPALIAAGEMIGLTTLVVTATLVLIAAIDVPFQVSNLINACV